MLLPFVHDVCFVERHRDQRPDPEVLLAVDPGDRRRQAEEHRTADGGVPFRRRDSRRRNTDDQNFRARSLR